MQNLTGQSIGRYHIIEQLGEGGMATVYKAYDTQLEREVAIKVIRIDAFPPAVLERMLKRFEREAKAMAKMSHPGIVKVYDYGEFEGTPYLVMEYLPGGTLKGLMGTSMPSQKAAVLLVPVAHALEYAHKRGVLHRDVKPANILITEEGQPVLTDFGIAKLLEDDKGHTLTGTGVGIGTPEYMAPEQGLGKEVDGRTDVYALGVVLYELVTGQKPFEADTPLAVLLKQVNDPLPRPREIAPDLSDQTEMMVFTAMAKNPEDRYEDMGSFANALERLAEEKAAPELFKPLKREVMSVIPSVQEPGTSEELDTGSVFIYSEKNKPGSELPGDIPKVGHKKRPGWVIGLVLTVIIILGVIIINQAGKVPGKSSPLSTETIAAEVIDPAPATTVPPFETIAVAIEPQKSDTDELQLSKIAVFEDGKKDQTFPVDIPVLQTQNYIKEGSKAILTNGWCANSKNTLEENTRSIDWFYFIDGIKIPGNRISSSYYENDSKEFCYRKYISMSNLKAGKYSFKKWMEIKINIDDGTHNFSPSNVGEINGKIIVGTLNGNQTSPENGDIVYKEGFSDSNTWRSEQGNFSDLYYESNNYIESGKLIYKILNTKINVNDRTPVNSFNIQTDYSIKLDFTMRETSPLAAAGIFFDNPDGEHHFLIYSNSTFSKNTFFDGKWLNERQGIAVTNFNKNATNTLEIRRIGEKAQIYLNDKMANQENGTDIEGDIGIAFESEIGEKPIFEFESLEIRIPSTK